LDTIYSTVSTKIIPLFFFLGTFAKERKRRGEEIARE